MQNRQNFPSRNGRYNQPNIQQAPTVSFSSGMTSQQKFNSIVQSVQISLAGKSLKITKGCEMHPKASPKCRKCQALIQQATKSSFLAAQEQKNSLNQVATKQDFVLCEQTPQQIKLNSQNPKNHLNQKLQTNITSSSRYKTLRQLKSVKQVLGELSSEQIPIQAYRKGTTEEPTQFMVTLYRIIELKPTKPQLTIMSHSNNVNVRALALIYVRIVLDFQQIYSFLRISFNDNKLINAYMTVGQLAFKLLTEQGMDQGGIRMPRIPTKIQKAIDRKVAQLKNSGEEKIQLQIPKQAEVVYSNTNEQKQGRNKSERSRSRQKDRKRTSSSSSSSSNSSSSSSSQSSNSQSEASQKVVKIDKSLVIPTKTKDSNLKNMLQNPTKEGSSLSDLKSRIQQSIKQKDQKQRKARILTQKYNAQNKIQQQQDKHSSYQQESNSVQKYQMN